MFAIIFKGMYVYKKDEQPDALFEGNKDKKKGGANPDKNNKQDRNTNAQDKKNRSEFACI